MTIRAFWPLLIGLAWPVTADEPAPPALMEATVYEGPVDVSEYWISEKLDGVRGRWDGETLRFRSGHPIQAPAWFTDRWPNVAMDGELWIGRGRFEEVSGIVRALEPHDAGWRKVRFMVFDLPSHPGPFEARVSAMRTLLGAAGVRWLRPVPQFRLDDVQALEIELDRVVAGGGEGLILHHRDARYRAGPSSELLKLKPYADAAARVVGHTGGRGKYAGMLGALIVERPDGLRFRLGSGFTDEQRASPPPVGSWVIYRHNGFTADGVPRFARFIGILGDAPRAAGSR